MQMKLWKRNELTCRMVLIKININKTRALILKKCVGMMFLNNA